MEPRALGWTSRPGDSLRAGRTLRSLQAAGMPAEEIGALTSDEFRRLLLSGAPLLLLRAGTWLARPAGLELPRPSATGKGLCALGAIRTPPETEAETTRAANAWRKLLAETGGDFGRLARMAHAANRSAGCSRFRIGISLTASRQTVASSEAHAGSQPATGQASSLRYESKLVPTALWPPASLFLDHIAVSRLEESGISSFEEVLLLGLEEFRLVHFAPLDVYDDPGL